MILAVAFIGIMLLSFGVMTFATKPSQGQQVMDRRLNDIRSSAMGGGASGTSINQLLKIAPDSRFGWLENLLQRYQFGHILETRILQANSKTTVARLLLTSGAFALIGFVVTSMFVSFLVFQLIAAGVLGYVPFLIVSIKRSRRLTAFNNALPDAIDMMARALRAGHSMVSAINMVAEQSVEPVASEFREVFKQQNFGVPLRDALMQMLDHIPSQDLRVLVTGILVQKDTGGNLAEILDRTVAVIRERLRIHGEIKTHTAQGRMTGWILCSLPVVMLLAINLVNPGYSNVLLDTAIGHKLMYVGLALLGAGGFIIRAIINGIEV